ncbi:MAG TPA: permease [Polyangiaceae bacterium]|nr:permease [Polyangiaceae bacterium]
MILIITTVALIATVFAFHKGVARQGVAEGGKLLFQVGPVLLPAFLLAGMLSVLVSPESLAQWLGRGAGLRALLLGTAAGALTPAGPFVAFPLVAVLLKAGASVGAVTAYVTAWALLGVHRVVAMEIPILGWRFAVVRYTVSLAVPVLTGFLAHLLWTKTS